jgi:hypothetical protein
MPMGGRARSGGARKKISELTTSATLTSHLAGNPAVFISPSGSKTGSFASPPHDGFALNWEARYLAVGARAIRGTSHAVRTNTDPQGCCNTLALYERYIEEESHGPPAPGARGRAMALSLNMTNRSAAPLPWLATAKAHVRGSAPLALCGSGRIRDLGYATNHSIVAHRRSRERRGNPALAQSLQA